MWDVLAAYLQTTTSNTQKGFNSVLREYFSFLGGDYNGQMGAEKFLNAQVLDAARYVRFAQEKKGVAPRSYATSEKAAHGTVRTKIATFQESMTF